MIAVDDSPYAVPTHDGSHQYSEELLADIRGMQIVTFGLIAGGFTFTAVALVMNGGFGNFDIGFLAAFGLVQGIFHFVAAAVVSRIIRHRQLSKIDLSEVSVASDSTRITKLMPVYRGTHIIACALLEGGAFVNLVFFVTDASAISLVAASVLLVAILLKMPTAQRVDDWINDASREIELR